MCSLGLPCPRAVTVVPTVRPPPPWDGLHRLQSRVHAAKMWMWPWAPSSTFAAVSAERQSPGTHTDLAHTHLVHTHTLNTLTCAPALHGHTPAEAEPSRFDGGVHRLARPLCCPECSPFPQSTMGQRQGLPAKGTVPQRVSCARSSTPRPGRDGPLRHRLPESGLLGSPGRNHS